VRGNELPQARQLYRHGAAAAMPAVTASKQLTQVGLNQRDEQHQQRQSATVETNAGDLAFELHGGPASGTFAASSLLSQLPQSAQALVTATA